MRAAKKDGRDRRVGAPGRHKKGQSEASAALARGFQVVAIPTATRMTKTTTTRIQGFFLTKAIAAFLSDRDPVSGHAFRCQPLRSVSK